MKSMAHRPILAIVRAFAATAIAMVILSMLGLFCMDNLNSAFFFAFYPSLLIGIVTYFMNRRISA